MNRRTFLSTSILGATVGAGPQSLTPAVPPAQVPSFEISRQVEISLPEKALEESFWIAAKLVSDMRRLAYYFSGEEKNMGTIRSSGELKDGWLAVSDGKFHPQHSFDPRDFRYGPKCAAYLYGDDPSFSLEMGKRIFLDQIDGKDGHINWDWKRQEQTSISLAHQAKHFSDYISYLEQDEFVEENWDRLLRMCKWALATYDRNDDGLIESGNMIPDYLWCLLVGEPYNFPRVPDCAQDVVVVSSMEMCELFHVLAAYAAKRELPESEWLQGRAQQAHTAIEGSAYDPDAGYYYLLYRSPEKKWYHSLEGIHEYSRELDVTPYYAALVSGNFSRATRVAQYAQRILLDDQVFPMPLQYPSYYWISKYYNDLYGFVNGGCWEEGYYNCVRAWSHCGMLAPLYEAIKRRSEAYVRDQGCWEWYTQKGEARGRDRYGISAAAHVSAIIEGLFGITPAGFGFSEIKIQPNFPLKWTGPRPAIRVTLPGNGFLKYVYDRDEQGKTLNLTVESDKQRIGHFRVLVPGPVESVRWNAEAVKCDVALQPGSGSFVFLKRPFKNDTLQIKFARCDAKGLPAPVCSSV